MDSQLLSEELTMCKTRDECMKAFAKDSDMLQHSAVRIFYRPSTDTYRYSPQQHGESGEQLYAILEKNVFDNAWLFRDISTLARAYLDNNPLPGEMMIGIPA